MADLQKEILDIRRLLEKKADKDMKPILQAYKRALDDLRTEIAKLYVKYAVDGQLQISKQQRYTVLKQLEKTILGHAKELRYFDLDHTTKFLEEIYQESYYRTAYIIDKGVEVAIDFAILNPEFVRAAVEMPLEGKMFSDRIWKNKENLVKKLRQEIERGMIQGDSIDKMTKRIKSELGTSAYESKRLLRTEMARCMSQAQSEIYKESKAVKQVMYDATLDNKTSEICQKLDGKYFDADSDYPKPPQHPNCRSCIIPVIENWSPNKKRDNETGEMIDYKNYEEWSKSKGITQ